MIKPDDKYGFLPYIPENIFERVISEVEDFASFMKHDPKGAERSVESDIEWIKDNKGYLGKAIEAAVDSILDLYSDVLTHREWSELRTYLLKGILLLLQMISEGQKEILKTS